MAEAIESGSHPPHRRHKSLSAMSSPPFSSGLCCIGRHRGRSMSLADHELSELFRDCRGFFSNCGAQTRRSSNGGNDDRDSNTSTDDDNDLYSKAPSQWKLFCRKVKEEAKCMRQVRPITPRFHYDSLSYAMNFDDGTALMWQSQEEGSLALRLHSNRFSGQIVSSTAIVAVPPAVTSPAGLCATA